MGNDNEKMVEAIHFHQPIFWDSVYLPGYGRIKKNEINRVSWIVGEKHLAVIINDEVRYCGKNFPYMSLDLSLEKVEPIVIGIQGSDKMMLKNSANYRRKTIC